MLYYYYYYYYLFFLYILSCIECIHVSWCTTVRNKSIIIIIINSKSWDNGHKSGNEKIETGMKSGHLQLGRRSL